MQTPWHTITINALATQLGTDVVRGLSSQEAGGRLEQTGPNELRKGETISPLSILLGQFRSLVIWVLIGAAMSLSSVSVISNALRLRSTKL